MKKIEAESGWRLKCIGRWAVFALVSSHVISTLYWNAPLDLQKTGADSDFAEWLSKKFVPVFRARAALRETFVGRFSRNYIRTFALEQRWWLVAPNPPHADQEIELLVASSSQKDEAVWMHGFTAADVVMDGSGLRELISLKKMMQPEYGYLIADYANYGIHLFKRAHPEEKAELFRVLATHRKFRFPPGKGLPAPEPKIQSEEKAKVLSESEEAIARDLGIEEPVGNSVEILRVRRPIQNFPGTPQQFPTDGLREAE